MEQYAEWFPDSICYYPALSGSGNFVSGPKQKRVQLSELHPRMEVSLEFP